ncbi:Uncharacterised protein [Corynebacterium renale]|uniref:Uncharacterized protein n=1 Tax=Corynebacterium renale TaxID=1724 RepID=A0A2A9DL00_9CORY|nr:hypothetical protein ATK06_0092 [Corynebacterium renale]SQI24266.1 Uncharacterised protein [Corynebacterium renale]
MDFNPVAKLFLKALYFVGFPLLIPFALAAGTAWFVYSAEADWRDSRPAQAAAGDYKDPARVPHPLGVAGAAFVVGFVSWAWMYVEMAVTDARWEWELWKHIPSHTGVAVLVVGLLIGTIVLLHWSGWRYGPGWLVASMMTIGFSAAFYYFAGVLDPDPANMFGVGWFFLIVGMGIVTHPACLLLVAVARAVHRRSAGRVDA